jgi:FXSXX-COOH protein
MTLPAEIPAELPDLRQVPLADLAALPPVDLAAALRRIQPRPARKVTGPDGQFSSSI